MKPRFVGLAVALVTLLAIHTGVLFGGQRIVKMATTTSTENSGLLAALLPPFEREYGIRVHVIAVGTGKALKLGENGDVDIVFVHARPADEEFVADGFGVNRREVMYNDFVIVGPAADPAQIRGSADAAAALTAIAQTKVTFVSRGDDSGTHKKEKALWQAARLRPEGRWYMEVGQGMGATLLIASEKGAYCLTDRGTFIAYRGKADLTILCQGDERLYNPYGIMAVNPARWPHVKYVEAMALIGWVTSPGGQAIIGGFKKEGQSLFNRLAIPRRK